MQPFDHATTAAAVAALMARPGCGRLTIANLPNSEYHRCPALSRSSLVEMLRSPAHFLAARTPDPTAPKREPKPAFQYGSLVHAMTLQPWLVREQYHRGPDVDDRRAKAWKEALAGIPEGCELVMRSDYRRALRQTRVLRSNKIVAEHMARPMRWSEVSLFWRDSVTDQWLMCRPDSMAIIGVPGHAGYGIEVVDLKTTSDASPSRFANSCADFHYDAQAAFYSAGVTLCTGLPVQSYLIVASESVPPFVTEVYDLTAEWIGASAIEMRQAIDRYAQCSRVDSWPGYSDGSVQLLQPPYWRAKQIERITA